MNKKRKQYLKSHVKTRMSFGDITERHVKIIITNCQPIPGRNKRLIFEVKNKTEENNIRNYLIKTEGNVIEDELLLLKGIRIVKTNEGENVTSFRKAESYEKGKGLNKSCWDILKNIREQLPKNI